MYIELTVNIYEYDLRLHKVPGSSHKISYKKASFCVNFQNIKIRDNTLSRKFNSEYKMRVSLQYDMVWHLGLLLKLSKTLPHWIVDTVALFLRDRRFRMHIGDKCNSWRLQRNGLPQGLVLSLCLFNVYINDLPSTHSRKFIYADDICLGTQEQTFQNRRNTQYRPGEGRRLF